MKTETTPNWGLSFFLGHYLQVEQHSKGKDRERQQRKKESKEKVTVLDQIF